MSKLTILLCTFNGDNYLEEQLNSFESQAYKNWDIVVSDDGSKDETLSILKKYQQKWGKNKMVIIHGPKQGFGINFLSLICNQPFTSEYYAFADQDDIWEPEKLERGIQFLQNQNQSTPSLYCSRTKLIDSNNNFLGYSPLFSKKPSFYNALVQSIAGGNTMIINKKTLQITSKMGIDDLIVSHDWLVYQIVTATNGTVRYDVWPSVLYRQHEQNKIGNNMMLKARIKRLYYFLRGDLKKWINQNLILLEKIDGSLSIEAKQALDHLNSLREKSPYEIIANLGKIKFYRQTYLGHIALLIGFILKRV